MTPKGVEHLPRRHRLALLRRVQNSVTPKGVEHPQTSSAGRLPPLRVQNSVTPKGVEHLEDRWPGIAFELVQNSVTPKGVEHAFWRSRCPEVVTCRTQ